MLGCSHNVTGTSGGVDAVATAASASWCSEPNVSPRHSITVYAMRHNDRIQYLTQGQRRQVHASAMVQRQN